MHNQYQCLGYLASDPQLVKAGESDKCLFTLASNYVKRDGTEGVDFVPQECWNGQARALAKHKKKGDLIFSTGSINRQTWTDDNGETQGRTVLTAVRVVFVGKKNTESVAEAASPDVPEAAQTSLPSDIPV